MRKKVEAVFDGEALGPEKPLGPPRNTRVRITIDDRTELESQSFIRTARSLNLDGPPEWSSRIEEYLDEKPH